MKVTIPDSKPAVPSVAYQLQEAFRKRVGSDGSISVPGSPGVEISRFSADTDIASAYSSLLPSNPFDEPIHLAAGMQEGQPRFSPDDMWRIFGHPEEKVGLPSQNSHILTRERTISKVQNAPLRPEVAKPEWPTPEERNRAMRRESLRRTTRPPNVVVPQRPSGLGVDALMALSPTETAEDWTSTIAEDEELEDKPTTTLSPRPAYPVSPPSGNWWEDLCKIQTPTSARSWVQDLEPDNSPTIPFGGPKISSSRTTRRARAASGSSTESAKAARILGLDTGKDSAKLRRASDEAKSAGWSPISPGLSRKASLYLSIGGRKKSAGHLRSESCQTWNTTHASYASTRVSSGFFRKAYDPTLDATCVYRALKESKKVDTDLLTQTLISVSYDPYSLLELRAKYGDIYGTDMVRDIRAGTSGHYRLAISRLVVGPHEAEAMWLNKSDSSFFMDDKLVAEALFGKTPDEIRAIKAHFEHSTGYPLHKALEDMYDGATAESGGGPGGQFGRACLRILKAERQSETVEELGMKNGDELLAREADLLVNVEDLYAGEQRNSNKTLNHNLLLELVLSKSDLYLAELCWKFHERHGKQLTELAAARDRPRAGSGPAFPANLVSI